MFKSTKAPALPPTTDFTGTLRESSFYKYGHLRSLGPGGEITSLAVDPLLSLLAVGTSAGVIHVYGNASFQFSLPITPPGVRPGRGSGVKFLAFHPGHQRIIAIDEGNTIHSFALGQISDSANPNVDPPLPIREAQYALFGNVTAIEQPLPSYTHMFLTMQDGTLLSWDLRQKDLSTYKVENLWALHEDRLVRSGVPGARKTVGGHKATSTALNPRDLNILLVGYDGGVVAWDFQKKEAVRTFELVLPPGAPGGGSYLAESLWTERKPTVTSVVWHPDGNMFAVGHEDGCIAFWAYDDADKPLMVRTLTHEDVNVTDAEALMSAGVLDTQLRSARLEKSGHDVEGMPVLQEQTAANANREPIFKLSWASFPDAAQLKVIATQDGVPLTNATAEYAERGETLLIVLGGQSPTEKAGINMLQFPAYKPPLDPTGPKKVVSPSEGLAARVRAAYRDSLSQTGASNYPTKTPPEDFTLLPRSSPYFGMAHDPVAIFILLTPDPRLPRPEAATAERQVESYVFPPPRSSESSVLGRKNYALGSEDIVAMTPAPRRDSDQPMQRVTSGASSNWRFRWGGGAASPTPSSASSIRSSTPSLLSPSISGRPMPRRRYRLPSQLWSGGLAVLGCRIVPLPTPTFKRLISRTLDPEVADAQRVPLRGGLAVPDLQTHGGPDLKVTKMENYRVLATWHADATVRFWDISPHILVLPTPLVFEYPAPLPHLTISIGKLLRHQDVAHLPLAKLWATDRTKVQIAGVYLARETLECVVTFKTGEVIVTKFSESRDEPITPQTPATPRFAAEDEDEAGEGPLPSSGESYFPPSSPLDGWVEEITEIDQLAKWDDDGFKPVAILTVRRGEVVACSVSDIGFIAVAYAENSLAVLDMRGPDVILREGFNEEGKTMKKRKRKGNAQNYPAENSVVGSMKWAISGIGGDATRRPRLIVSYEKGTTKIYSLSNVLGEWVVDAKPPTFQNESLAAPLATFLLDPVEGHELGTSPEALADVLEHRNAPEGKWKAEAPPHCLWVAASKKAIRVAVNFNGERVAKVEFEEEELSDVHYITRHGHRIIVALTTTGSALFYTAPHLEYITRMDLYFGSTPRPLGKLSFDDRSGDFIEYSGPLDIALRTMFHFRKPFPPRIDPCFLKTPIPAQPQRLDASYFGWMWGTVLTGAALDALIGGPHRKAAPKPPAAPKKPLITWGDVPEPEPVVAAPTKPQATKYQPRKAKAPVADARERRDVYSQVQDSLRQRDDMMDTLGDSIDSAAAAASKFFSQAGKSAAKQGAKATGRGIMSKLF